MNRSSILLAAITTLAAAACAPNKSSTGDSVAAATPTVDTAGVQRAIDSANARLSTSFTKADAQGLGAEFADDAIAMEPNVKAARGRNEVDKLYAAKLRSARFPSVSFKTTDLVVNGQFAIESGTYDITTQPQKGSPVRDVGKYLTVWKKQPDGSWKIFRDIGNTDQPAP